MALNCSKIPSLRLPQVIWSVMKFYAQILNQSSSVPTKLVLACATHKCLETWHTQICNSQALTQLATFLPESPWKMISASGWCECWWSLIEREGLVSTNLAFRFNMLNASAVTHTLSCCIYLLGILPFYRTGITGLYIFFDFFGGILNKRWDLNYWCYQMSKLCLVSS